VAVWGFVESLTVLVTAVGGRKDTEVAGRGCIRGIETGPGPIREVEAIRPVAVAGRVGGFICGDFLVEPTLVAACAACPRFEERRFEFAILAARAPDGPFVTCSTFFEASPPPRRAKGVESSVNVKHSELGGRNRKTRLLAVFGELKKVPLGR
jgi:hypothetical protein